MKQATVLVPTFDHVETLTHSLASACAQTVTDIEIFVIGDGAPERTRELVAQMARADPRIRFFGHPKGERHGELYRHAALREAAGRVVCYLCDDDLWLPTHIAHVLAALGDADLGNTVEVVVPPDCGPLRLNLFDPSHPPDRENLRNARAGFGLACGAHTLDAYRRLPHGWRTTPRGINTDLYMWQQFIAQPWCRAVAVPAVTVLKFGAPQRLDWTPERRLAELAHWSTLLREPGFGERLAVESLKTAWRPTLDPRLPSQLIEQAQSLVPQAYEPGVQLHFHTGGNAVPYLSWGWAEGESWGRWTMGGEARLLFQLPSPPREWVLEAMVQGFVGPRVPTREVLVAVNGNVAATWTFQATEPALLRAAIPPATNVDLRFLMPGITPASQAADTADPRPIGLGVLWLRLRDATS